MKRRILVHLLGAAISAAIWGIATRIAFVPVMIVLSEIVGIWFPPPERTSVARHVARAILFGGTWAATGLLVFG